jgi:hemolysin activation/secretion protein
MVRSMLRGHAVLVLGGLCVALCAQAQTPQDVQRALQQQEQIIQQQRELERQQREAEEARRRKPSGQELKPKPQPEAAQPGAACSPVAEIVLEGASKLEPMEQARLAAPYLDRCLSLADINRLIADITNRYVELGFVTTRVYIPQQDLGSKRLVLKIVEGKVQSIVIDPASSASAATAFPGLAGDVLNLRDLEQGLDQINRLASNSAKIDIEPGDEPGQSRVVIRNQPRKAWLANASVDNSGIASTGRTLFSAGLSGDNLLGLNDYVSGTFRYSERSNREYSESGGLYGAVPYGYWTFSSALNWFRYDSLVQGSVTTFETRGTSNSQMLRADRVVFRDQARKLSFAGGITLKQFENFLAGLPLDISSANLTVLDVGANLSWIGLGGVFTFDAGIAKGVAALGATFDDSSRAAGAPQAQFEKYTYGASVYKPFSFAEQAMSWTSRLYGQYSQDPLYGIEQMAIGNLYTVRGFRNTVLAGRTGYYVRNDVGMPIQVSGGQVKPFLGYDLGHVEQAGTLQGWAIGLEAAFAAVSLSLAYAQPIQVPTGFKKEDGWFYARLAIQY